MRSILAGLSLLLVFGLCGCQSMRKDTSASNAPQNANAKLATRNNALALLDDLLNDEKNVSKILIIKHNSDELGKLIKEISDRAGEGAKDLEALAKSEPGLNLKQLDLPPGETATRQAISKTKEHLLLHTKDAEFEFQLLLTQIEALNYGDHLTMVIAENEPNVDRARVFLGLGAQLRDLHERVLAILRSKKY